MVRVRPVRMVIWIVVAATLLAAPARAADDKARANALYKAGVHLFKAGKHREALSQFQEARRLAVIPDAVWSIARCHEELGEPEAALAAYQDFEAMARDATARAEARRRIVAVKDRYFGRLRVAVEPPGTGIQLDGEPVGEAPLAGPLDVRAGEHLVTMSKRGFATQHRRVEVPAGGDASVETAMVAMRAESGPAGADGSVAAPAAPRRGWSPLKAGLFFGGVGAVVAGVALHVAGFEHYRRINDSGGFTYPEKRDARALASGLGYGAYALYGVGAAAVVTSFLVPAKGRHPIGYAAAPAPGGGAVVLTGRW
ncbi:MAG: PEGA domain-containing protein [Deltaproteobacteria bacterium]|nr:PEGA domain-containing protein [Deltaproteobacteria bacterium]